MGEVYMITFIGEMVEMIPCISKTEKNQMVDRIFTENENLHGVVVLDQHKPIAFISRTLFYQKIGTLYGYNLYMGRTVELLIQKKPLIVDYMDPITKVSKLAMNRAEDELYDNVIVIKNDRFYGVVSIRSLLMKFAEIQTEMAIFLNPLTGLPGNPIIQQTLKNCLQNGEFSVLYIDLDHFKAYNDTYGFKKGDDFIQATAHILMKNITDENGFVGHIGGDDFIIILGHYEYEKICDQIIQDFNEILDNFYLKEHLLRQFIMAENRYGKLEKIPLVSISIAVVTNQDHHFNNVEDVIVETTRLKKICKSNSYSCYYANVM